MTASPITSWQIDGQKVKAVTDFNFLGSKITADSDCRWWPQPWNYKMLAPWKECYDKPRQCIKKQRHHFANKVHIIKAMVFLVVMYGCESWMIKAECQRIYAFNLWCWRKLLRVPWTVRKSNQSILQEINQSWIFTGRTDAEADALILWPPDGKSQLIGKDPDVGKD